MEIDSLQSFVKMISDFGIMVIISAGVVFFIFKLLSMLLKQNQKMIDDLIPKMTNIEKLVEKDKSDIMGAISAHNSYVQNQLSDMKRDLDNISKSVDRIDREQHEFLSNNKDD